MREVGQASTPPGLPAAACFGRHGQGRVLRLGGYGGNTTGTIATLTSMTTTASGTPTFTKSPKV
jgi:hypothetical protein